VRTVAAGLIVSGNGRSVSRPASKSYFWNRIAWTNLDQSWLDRDGVPRLFDALALARGDGRLDRLLRSLARVELLILDDWGLSSVTAEQRRDLLEIMEDRLVHNAHRLNLKGESLPKPTAKRQKLDAEPAK